MGRGWGGDGPIRPTLQKTSHATEEDSEFRQQDLRQKQQTRRIGIGTATTREPRGQDEEDFQNGAEDA